MSPVGGPLAPAPGQTITRTEYLAIDGVSLATPAWLITDLTSLHDSAEVRGSDRLLPGVAGVTPYRRRRTVTRKSLPMVIFGDADRSGASLADVRAGLWSNLAFLKANVVAPVTTGDGTRTAVLWGPGGASRSAPVHVLELRVNALGPAAWRATLELSIPAGELT